MRRGKCWSDAGEWENLHSVRESFWKEPFQVWKELAPVQRLYSQASNAVLHTLYETMSMRELLEEIGERRVRKTRACNWRASALQTLVEADKAWVTHAKIHSLPPGSSRWPGCINAGNRLGPGYELRCTSTCCLYWTGRCIATHFFHAPTICQEYNRNASARLRSKTRLAPGPEFEEAFKGLRDKVQRKQILAAWQNKYGPLKPDESRILWLLAYIEGATTKRQSQDIFDVPPEPPSLAALRTGFMIKEAFHLQPCAYSLTELAGLCKNIGLTVGRKRDRAAYEDALTKFRAGRQSSIQMFETLARSARTLPKEIPGNWFWICNEVLEMQYDTMTRKALAREAKGRRITLTPILARLKGRKRVRHNRKLSARVLRSRLHESDESFEERVPRSGCLEDLSAAALRSLAGHLSVQQGDRTIATLAGNIRKFAEQRFAGYEQRMGGPRCWDIPPLEPDAPLRSDRTRLHQEFFRKRRPATPH